MKSFQAMILAALVVSTVAVNEPIASPTAAIEREFAEYERQLGTDMSMSVGPKAAKAKGAKENSLDHSMSYNYNSVKEEAKALIEAGNLASALELFEGKFESFVHSLEAEAEKLAQVSKTLPLPAATANGSISMSMSVGPKAAKAKGAKPLFE